jgi:hypothetical protein
VALPEKGIFDRDPCNAEKRIIASKPAMQSSLIAVLVRALHANKIKLRCCLLIGVLPIIMPSRDYTRMIVVRSCHAA